MNDSERMREAFARVETENEHAKAEGRVLWAQVTVNDRQAMADRAQKLLDELRSLGLSPTEGIGKYGYVIGLDLIDCERLLAQIDSERRDGNA